MLFFFSRPLKTNIKVTIIGDGSVGAYFILQLIKNHNIQISLLVRDDKRRQAIHDNGFNIITSVGETHLSSTDFANITSNPLDLPKQDLLIIAVKQPDFTESLAETILVLSNERTKIGIVCNGIPFYFFYGLHPDKYCMASVDKTGNIARTLRNMRVFCVDPFIAAEKTADNTVRIIRPFDKITVQIAGISAQTSTQELEQITELFKTCEINVKVAQTSAHKVLLEKLQFALSINVLSALLTETVDKCFEDESTQTYIIYCINLINSIATEFHIQSMRNYQQLKALQVTKGHFSSLCKDIQNKRPNEINAIVAATIEIAEFINAHRTKQLLNIRPLYLVKKLLEEKAQHKNAFNTAQIMEIITNAVTMPNCRLKARL